MFYVMKMIIQKIIKMLKIIKVNGMMSMMIAKKTMEMMILGFVI